MGVRIPSESPGPGMELRHRMPHVHPNPERDTWCRIGSRLATRDPARGPSSCLGGRTEFLITYAKAGARIVCRIEVRNPCDAPDHATPTMEVPGPRTESRMKLRTPFVIPVHTVHPACDYGTRASSRIRLSKAQCGIRSTYGIPDPPLATRSSTLAPPIRFGGQECDAMQHQLFLIAKNSNMGTDNYYSAKNNVAHHPLLLITKTSFLKSLVHF